MRALVGMIFVYLMVVLYPVLLLIGIIRKSADSGDWTCMIIGMTCLGGLVCALLFAPSFAIKITLCAVCAIVYILTGVKFYRKSP
jgi:hypothetical protein